MAVGGQIQAAGGVIRRPGPAGLAELTVVHRPRYDDWSWPKGKLDEDESFEEAALREVEEETGWRCRLGPELPSTRYRDNKDRSKVVRYWAMEPLSGDGKFSPNDEIDDIRWLPASEARQRLSYDHDQPVVEALEPPPPG